MGAKQEAGVRVQDDAVCPSSYAMAHAHTSRAELLRRSTEANETRERVGAGFPVPCPPLHRVRSTTAAEPPPLLLLPLLPRAAAPLAVRRPVFASPAM